LDVVMRRLAYDPTKSCPRGHTTVKPYYRPYETGWGPVRRFTCSTCCGTYSEVIKPEHKFDAALLVSHYWNPGSSRRFPVVSEFFAECLSGLTKEPGQLCSESTFKRKIKKYSTMAKNATPDNITRLFHPHLSGFFGFDGLIAPTITARRVNLIAQDLVREDIVSSFFAPRKDPCESRRNCDAFVSRFRETMDYVGVDIIQIVLDDRKELWNSCENRLQSYIVLTLDGEHFLREIKKKYLPERFRTPKQWVLIASIEYAVRLSRNEQDARQIFKGVADNREYWLDGETERGQSGIQQTLSKINEGNISRLLSHFQLVERGNRMHFRTTNRTEGGAVGVLRQALDDLNCLQSEQSAPSQLNIIQLVSRLMPATRDRRSSLQRGKVNKTLHDLIPILHAFDPNSPIQ